MSAQQKYEKCETHETVTTQPMTTVVQVSNANPLLPRGNQRDWSTGLCSCMDDVPICLLGCFFGPCYQCCVASNMGESCCVPCCVPGSLIAMRTQIRGRHNIQGSIMSDCLTSCTCTYPCAQCQLGREVKNIKSGKAQI